MRFGRWCMRAAVASLVAMLVLGLMVAVSGCSYTDAERVQLAEAVVRMSQERVTAAEAEIRGLREDLAAARAAFSDPNLSAETRTKAEQTAAKLEGALTHAEQYRKLAAEVLADAQAAVVKAKENPAQGQWDILTAVVQSVTAKLGPQAAAWGTVGTIALTILGNIFQRRKLTATKAEAADVKAAATAVVQGVEDAPAEAAGPVKAKIAKRMERAGQYNTFNGIVDELKAA